jgi:hypothetical protein
MRALLIGLFALCGLGCVLPDFERSAADGGIEGVSEKLPGKACGVSDQLPRDCDACIRKECCELAEACPAGSDCGKDLLHQITPVSEVSSDFEPLLGCMQSQCNAACKVDWGCVGEYSWPVPKDEYGFDVSVVDFAAEPEMPLPGVTVAACQSVDPACESGRVSEAVTGKTGRVSLTVPQTFDGFFSFSGGDHAPSTAQWTEPVYRISDFTQYQLSEGALQALAAASGVHSTPQEQFDAKVGHMIFRVQNCVPQRFLHNLQPPRAEAADVQVSFGEQPGASRIFYVDKSSNLSLTLEATSTQGVGGVFNLPARNLSVTATDAISGDEIADGTVVVRPGAIGFIYLLPKARQ